MQFAPGELHSEDDTKIKMYLQHISEFVKISVDEAVGKDNTAGEAIHGATKPAQKPAEKPKEKPAEKPEEKPSEPAKPAEKVPEKTPEKTQGGFPPVSEQTQLPEPPKAQPAQPTKPVEPTEDEKWKHGVRKDKFGNVWPEKLTCEVCGQILEVRPNRNKEPYVICSGTDADPHVASFLKQDGSLGEPARPMGKPS